MSGMSNNDIHQSQRDRGKRYIEEKKGEGEVYMFSLNEVQERVFT